jgi:uncharacterized membrane protein YeaQ/YmgE (transglycosylase-associated protein family)
MVWLWVILIGFVVGLVARAIMPGPDPAGFVLTVLLGIVGSLFVTWLGREIGLYRPGDSAEFHALRRPGY